MSNAHKTRWLSSEHLLNASGCIILGNFNGNSTFLCPADLLQQMHYQQHFSCKMIWKLQSFARPLVRLMLRSQILDLGSWVQRLDIMLNWLCLQAMAFNCLLTLMLMSRNEARVKVKHSTITAWCQPDTFSFYYKILSGLSVLVCR